MKIAKTERKFYDMRRDGVTQSLIAMWLSCRQKAKFYLEGWDSKYHSPALTFGSLTHGVLEDAYLDIKANKLKGVPSKQQVIKYTDIVEARWRTDNRGANTEALEYMEESLAILERIIPIYFQYWAKDFQTKKWVSLEEKFEMPITFLSRNGIEVSVPIRGKSDGVFRGKSGLYLFETKTKSFVNESDLMETLGFEQQVMTYLVRTMEAYDEVPRGALYNVIRKTALKRAVKEDVTAFAKKVEADVLKRPDFYFLRIESPTSEKELVNYHLELEKILKEMYDWWMGDGAQYRTTGECLGKFGKCPFLLACSRNEFNSLVKRKAIFKELEN